MHRSVIRQRLLIAMGAGGFATTLACGSGDTTASLSDSSMEAAPGSQDAPGGTSVAANESGSGEASSRDAAGENVGTHDAAGADPISQADALDASSADAHDATDELPMTVRRPFLVGGSLRQAKAIARNDWGRALPPCVPTLDPRTAHALYRPWRDDGIQEHASIAPFARFTMM